MFVVLLNIVDNSAGNLYARKEEEVSQDEKNFAVLVEMGAHVVLEHKQIVFSVISTRAHKKGRICYLVLTVVVAISQRENVITQLQHHHRKVDFG